MAHPAKKMVAVSGNIRDHTAISPNGVAGKNPKICNERLHDFGCESVACTQQLIAIEDPANEPTDDRRQASPPAHSAQDVKAGTSRIATSSDGSYLA